MNTMEMLKKTLAFTIGAAEFSADRLKGFADEMVSRGEMSSEDARSFIDDVSKRADEQKQTIQDWIREQTTKMVQQMGAVEAERVGKLEQRVAQLEMRVAKLTGETVCEEEPPCIVDPTTGECVHGSGGE